MAVALAEKQQTTLVDALATSSGITLVLASLVSLLIVYSLVLFIKGFINSFKTPEIRLNGSGGGRASAKRNLCQNCSILHGLRSASSGKQLTDYHYPRGDGDQILGLTCSECSVGLGKEQQRRAGKNIGGFYGKNLSSGADSSAGDDDAGPVVEQAHRSSTQAKEVREENDDDGDDDNGELHEQEKGCNAERQQVDEKREVDFDCSLQTVLELGEDQASRATRDEEAQVDERDDVTVGDKNRGLLWRKIAQANSMISIMRRIAQEKSSKYKEQLASRLSSPSSSSNSPLSPAEEQLANCEPEFLNSRTLRTAQIQINYQQQHQIIFGKSKDSILVPELVCGATAAATIRNKAQQAVNDQNGSNKLIGKKPQQERHGESDNLAVIGLGTNEFTSGEAQTHLAHLTGYNFPPVTTRVLTDEKGHSIKIRIASPPPQRQEQLVKLHRQQFEDSLAAVAAAEAAAAALASDRHRDSVASDCPLVSLDTTVGGKPGQVQQQRPQSAANERDESVFEAKGGGGPTEATFDGKQPRHVLGDHSSNSISNKNRKKIKRRHSVSEPSKFAGQAEMIHEETRAERESGESAAVGAPIEAFNDSNTSEFDDVPGCDSRQDTSLDYQNQLNDTNGACIPTAQRRANDQVMDADLRQANRLNLELALLQNTATQNMCLGGGIANKSALSGVALPSERQQLAHHNQHHLPQSGVLHLASEFCVNAGQQQQQRRQRARRQSSQEDYDSGCAQMGEESRRSSCFTGLERQAPVSPTSVQTCNPVPSLRIKIRRLPSVAGANSTAARPRLDRTSSKENRPPSTKVSLFYTMGISSLSRSKSLEDGEAPTIERGVDSQSTTGSQPRPDSDALYEISLVEARNVLKLAAGQSWAPATSASDEQAAGRSSSPVPTHNRRRSSLLGALGFGGGGGGSPSSQRRSSIDGVFVRVFKQAADDEAGEQTAPTKARQQQRLQSIDQPDACDMSLSSYSSLGSSPASRPDFIQLPLVKLAAAGDHHEKHPQAAHTAINFEQLAKQGYKFTCSLHELPMRVSLYMVSKRGGARYTLGHCILAPEDWKRLDQGRSVHRPGSIDEGQHFWPSNKFVVPAEQFEARRAARRSLSSGTSSNAFETISESQESGDGNELDATNEIDGDDDDDGEDHDGEQEDGPCVLTLEYRLHQTILEAIKSY